MWMNDRDSDTAFFATEQMLSERQIDFDIINDDFLAEAPSTVGCPTCRFYNPKAPGILRTASGDAYSVVVPSASVLSQAAFDRLKALAEGGGKVLFLGRTPSLISGKTILDACTATPADFAWAVVAISAQLPPTPTPSAYPPTAPLTPQIVPAAHRDRTQHGHRRT